MSDFHSSGLTERPASEQLPSHDGNKRLAWGCLNTFCALYGYNLFVISKNAISAIHSIAAGETDEQDVTAWITARIVSSM